MTEPTRTTKAQDKSMFRLARDHGGVFIVGKEPDGASIRVRWAGLEPVEDRERIIRPSGLVLEPVT